MKIIEYTLALKSDAELGSGLGGEIVDSTVTRDQEGRPVIRASHLKGLMRDRLQMIAAVRKWKDADVLLEICFGRENRDGDGGQLGMISFSDSVAQGKASTRTISRTSLTELGVARSTSLRTTEAVAAKTTFVGRVRILDGAPPITELSARLALLSIVAVGGGRTRGGGACGIAIEGEDKRLPGELLKALDQEVQKGVPHAKPPTRPQTVEKESADASAVLLRLVFKADGPVCCPETPVVGSNVIQSGLGIPPSAVQGAIISLLAARDQPLAQAAFEDPRTRFWPLLPCGEQGAQEPYPIPVRVDLSHRMSKLPDEGGGYAFKDAAIAPYDWRKVANGSPLKGADGVLLRHADGHVELWRSHDMTWVLTSHSVHHNERSLFTVEALAPMVFSGWVSLPPKAAKTLLELLKQDGQVAFGKARTVRGTGTLCATPDELDLALSGDWKKHVFVLQSPAAIPDEWPLDASAEELLARLVEESGWGKVKFVERTEGQIAVNTQAQCGVRFGWNRHGVGGSNVQGTQRLQARRVFLPGTVFVLEKEPENLLALLRRGLGVERNGEVDGRFQGYGAVMAHPGIATVRRSTKPKFPSVKSKDDASKWAVEWFRATDGKGPSPSQISAVAGRIKDSGGKKAIKFLERQRDDRSARIWERWKPVFDDVMRAIEQNEKVAARALRIWQDLAIANREKTESSEGR